ncbi:hypothetical protein [Streptomyces longispororuber]|uniref:hypothetical protein n=1 Tax=Streptomyces longispororuber TaxID=68230 RepID=UPI00370111FE
MRRITNLAWPDTPYGATDHLVQRKKRLLTGLALLWADSNGGPVLMGAAAVLVPVHRTKTTYLAASPLHIGYLALLAEHEDDTRPLVKALDELLVQARRDAPALAWHSAADDQHVLHTVRHGGAGVTGITAAWKARKTPPKGIARCVDTALDIGDDALLVDAARHHGLPLDAALIPHQDQSHVQQRYQVMTAAHGDPAALRAVTGSIAAGALAQAYTVALLGGRHLHLLDWVEPPTAYASLERAAWDELPPGLFRTTAAT